MKTLKLILAALITATMFTSCSEEGPPGVQGPTGNDGPTGSTGINGANPLIINFDTLKTTGWTVAVPGVKDTIWVNPLVVDTLSNCDSDVVVVYAQGIVSPYDFYCLPCSNFDTIGTQLSFSYNTTIVTFYYQTPWSPSTAPASPIPAKVVVIPPAIMKRYPGLNVKSYHAVMSLYNQLKAGRATN
ncbi:MAG: hypothetical protein ACLQQ4_00260 [Bacteroidia bacterium]